MQKVIILILASLFISCGRTDPDENIISQPQACKITSVSIVPFSYEDVNIYYTTSSDFPTRLTFNYDSQNRISKVIGSFISVSGQPLSQFILSTYSEDEITYSNGIVYNKVASNQLIRPYEKSFEIINDRIISQTVTNLYPIQSNPYMLTYVYSGNKIEEKNPNGVILRTFTIENENLTKIDKWIYDTSGTMTGKWETTFSDFDDKENMLKGKFFINGAFELAFSKNNWRKKLNKNFNLVNGVFEYSGYLTFADISYQVNSGLFTKICN